MLILSESGSDRTTAWMCGEICQLSQCDQQGVPV